jgi:hypothetical protein
MRWDCRWRSLSEICQLLPQMLPQRDFKLISSMDYWR